MAWFGANDVLSQLWQNEFGGTKILPLLRIESGENCAIPLRTASCRRPDKNLLERQRKLQRLITIIAGCTISIVVGGILWGIIYEIIIGKGEVIAGSLFLIFIIGLILFASLVVYKESLEKTKVQRRTTQLTQPQEEESKNLPPPPYLEPISSVTEETTELLLAEDRKRKG